MALTINGGDSVLRSELPKRTRQEPCKNMRYLPLSPASEFTSRMRVGILFAAILKSLRGVYGEIPPFPFRVRERGHGLLLERMTKYELNRKNYELLTNRWSHCLQSPQ